MRPRYGRSLKRTGDLVSSSEANATGALELNVDPVDEDASTSRDGICGDEVSRTLFPPEDGAERPICASLSEDEGGPSIVASIPADSSRATISSASSRGRLSSRTSAHVLVSVSKVVSVSSPVSLRICLSFSSASSRDTARASTTRYKASSLLEGSGDSSRGSTRTRPVSSATSFEPPPLAFINWPVVEITADRALRSEEHTSELQSRLHLVCR